MSGILKSVVVSTLQSCQFFNKKYFTAGLRLTRTLCSMSIRHLNQNEAINLDQELFNVYKFSVDQLMELVGLACSHVVAEEYPDTSKKVLVCVGPGNNGGDGLVCSRHLKQIGYNPEIIYPKRVDKQLYNNLFNQCEMHDIPFLENVPSQENMAKYSVIVDAIFGFSFKPPVRPLFVPLLEALAKTEVPIVSIDIPSGWDVEKGPNTDCPMTFHPHTLISCSTPKLCAKYFEGENHYLAGNFIPLRMQKKYQLNFPTFGTRQIYKIPNSSI